MPVFKSEPESISICIEVIAEVLRHSPTALSTVPLPFLSRLDVINTVLLVDPAYEKMSAVHIEGIVVLNAPKEKKYICPKLVCLSLDAAVPLPRKVVME